MSMREEFEAQRVLINLFERWKGYELPDLNSDNQFDKEWLHREWVAFQAGYQAGLASQAQQPTIPHDFYTHRQSWRKAIELAEMYGRRERPDVDDKAYWRHELRAFDRAYAELQSQAQQSQWISVDEYDPINGELVYVFHKTVREVAIAVCETSKHYSRFTSNKFGSEPTSYYTHVSRIHAPLPPAPVSDNEQPEGE